MDYNSIVFREFTHESLQRIKYYREEEEAGRLEQQKIREDDNAEGHCMNKSSKDEPIGHKRIPNKELAVGQQLPRVLQSKFPGELIGKPIEEIDCYYRLESVCRIFRKYFCYFLKS
jgi:hypothetical protein